MCLCHQAPRNSCACATRHLVIHVLVPPGTTCLATRHHMSCAPPGTTCLATRHHMSCHQAPHVLRPPGTTCLEATRHRMSCASPGTTCLARHQAPHVLPPGTTCLATRHHMSCHLAPHACATRHRMSCASHWAARYLDRAHRVTQKLFFTVPSPLHTLMMASSFAYPHMEALTRLPNAHQARILASWIENQPWSSLIGLLLRLPCTIITSACSYHPTPAAVHVALRAVPSHGHAHVHAHACTQEHTHAALSTCIVAYAQLLCVHASLNASTHAGNADAPGNASARTTTLDTACKMM